LNTLKLAGQCGKLKCCLNYELDTYLDALKDIPDRIENLQTEIGTARHQKTDIFKKLMWFSYPNQEDWIPLKVDRVKEIMAMNKKGQKPSNLKDEAVELQTSAIVEKIPDYENVVGQDSLTRLDDKPRNKNNRTNKNKGNTPGNRPERAPRPAQANVKPAQTAAKPAQPGQKPQQSNQKLPQQGPKQAPQGQKPVQQGPRQAPNQRNGQPNQRPPQNGPKMAQPNQKPAENRKAPEVRTAPLEGDNAVDGEAGKAPSANRNNRNRNNRRRNKPSDKPKNEES
jgi:hypothetical protein